MLIIDILSIVINTILIITFWVWIYTKIKNPKKEYNLYIITTDTSKTIEDIGEYLKKTWND